MATKKTATTRGHAYELTAKGTKELAEAGGQQSVIFRALKGKALTASQLTSKVGSQLKTKQDKSLVVGFYLTNWKADGRVRFAKKAVKPRTTKKVVSISETAAA